MQIQSVYQSLPAGKYRLIVAPSLGHQRISQQTIPNCMCFVPPRRIQNGKIKPREEFLCIWLHHVPRRVAQHRIESALAGPFMPEHFWEGQVPWQCLAPGGQHRFLPLGQNSPAMSPSLRPSVPAPAIRHLLLASPTSLHRTRHAPGDVTVAAQCPIGALPKPSMRDRRHQHRRLPATPEPDGALPAAPHLGGQLTSCASRGSSAARPTGSVASIGKNGPEIESPCTSRWSRNVSGSPSA